MYPELTSWLPDTEASGSETSFEETEGGYCVPEPETEIGLADTTDLDVSQAIRLP